MAVIKCVMFDLGNVLVTFDTKRFYTFIYRHRDNQLEPYELFTGAGQYFMEDYYLGNLSDSDFFENVANLFQLRHVSEEGFFRVWGDVMEFDYEMIALVKRLKKRGLLTVLVTNIGRYHINYIREKYSEFLKMFDNTFISYEERVIKPDLEAWTRPLGKLGLNAAECIFLDDHYPNIEVARKLGVKGWHLPVIDENFCSNGKIDIERQRFIDFLFLLDNLGLLYDKNKIR